MKKFFYLLSVVALCLVAASCENDNTGSNEVSLNKMWLVTLQDSYSENGISGESVTKYLFDMSEEGYIRIGMSSTGYIADGLEENEFVEWLPKTACTINKEAETEGNIQIEVEGETVTILYSSLTPDSVTLKSIALFDTDDDIPASAYTQTAEWVVMPEDGEQGGNENEGGTTSNPGGSVWTCNLGEEGIYCLDFSEFDAESYQNGDAVDYGSFKFGALEGTNGQDEGMSGRITYYSEQDKEFKVEIGTEAYYWWKWDSTETGITFSLDEDDDGTPDMSFECEAYTGPAISWN